MKSLLISVSFLLLTVFSLFSQERSNKMHTIRSDAFGKERTIRVFLPERYFTDTLTDFSVVYVLDAQSDAFWNMAAGNVGYLVRSYCVLPMIAVGISSDNRGAEFTPPATELTKHFEEEVFPLIEQTYRVNSFRALVGHSWGGAFLGHTLFGGNSELFNAYIGLSPSLGYSKRSILVQADSCLQQGKVFKKYLYCSTGNLGSLEISATENLNLLDSLMNKYPNKTPKWDLNKLAKTDHWSSVIPALGEGLVWMSRNYFIDLESIDGFAKNKNRSIKEQIEQFYTQQAENFGFVHQSSARYFRFLGDNYRDSDQYEEAIQIYDYAITIAPEDIALNMNIADTYGKMNDSNNEKKALQKVINLLNAQQSQLDSNFYNNCLNWAKERFKKYE